jgi:ABC-2 type transport system permease protein
MRVRYHLMNPLLFITGALLLLAFSAVSSDSIQVGGAIGQINRNTPVVIFGLLATKRRLDERIALTS